jgi:archaetidylinositol phosphate synthase
VVLDAYRHLADAVLNPLARRLTNVSPNALSWGALVSAGFAGTAFLFRGGWPLVAGALFVFLNALLDALDGKVAKMTGKASRRGDFLDHVFDRYADVFMLGGITLGPYCSQWPWLGLLAIIGVLLTSYMGTQAQAVGAGRDYGGALGRADRLVILVAAALLQAVYDPNSVIDLGIGDVRYTVLAWTMALFAVLGNLTAIQRGVATWRHLT